MNYCCHIQFGIFVGKIYDVIYRNFAEFLNLINGWIIFIDQEIGAIKFIAFEMVQYITGLRRLSLQIIRYRHFWNDKTRQ